MGSSTSCRSCAWRLLGVVLLMNRGGSRLADICLLHPTLGPSLMSLTATRGEPSFPWSGAWCTPS
eukprot:7631301-Alexandrium_andersonii.AAC.1